MVADLTALPGARVAGEHAHPALLESFSVQEGELTMLRDGQKAVLRAGERAEIEPGVWHDWWNEGDADAIVRVEITPGERFVHMIETLFGLAREGHVSKRGMPHPLQLPLLATEFSDVSCSADHRLSFKAFCSARSRRSPAAAATRDLPHAVENGTRPPAFPATLPHTEPLGREDRRPERQAARLRAGQKR